MKKNLLKRDGVQSLIASLLCVVLGLLIGYIVLLIINPAGAGEAISTVIKNFLTYKKPETQMKYFGNTLVRTAPLLMCSLSILFAYKAGLFNIGAAGQYCAGAGMALYAALAWHMPWWLCMIMAFCLGARSVCPSATMKVRYTGSWYDQAKEQEAATALIEKDKGVLISQHADSLGAPTACELAGVPNVSYNGSTYSAGETTFIISSAINWAPYFQYIIETVVKGEAIAPDWCGTIATNSVVLSGVNQDVAADGTIEKINEAIKALEAGTLHVFDTANFTVDGKTLTEYLADVDGDYTGETNVIHDGYFDESNAVDFRSAPYFDIIIDGVTNLNTNFGG